MAASQPQDDVPKIDILNTREHEDRTTRRRPRVRAEGERVSESGLGLKAKVG